MTAIEVAMPGGAYGPELARVVRAHVGCSLAAGCGLRHR